MMGLVYPPGGGLHGAGYSAPWGLADTVSLVAVVAFLVFVVWLVWFVIGPYFDRKHPEGDDGDWRRGGWTPPPVRPAPSGGGVPQTNDGWSFLDWDGAFKELLAGGQLSDGAPQEPRKVNA
jgi:hypothetical protein